MSAQLADFFGPVDLFIAEQEGEAGALAYSIADGNLVTEVVGGA